VLELVSDLNSAEQKQLASVMFKNTLMNPTKVSNVSEIGSLLTFSFLG